MKLNTIDSGAFTTQINHLWNNDWLLLTSGNFEAGKFNTMTVAWGSLGMMWSKPFAQVVVRHSRFTFDFMEKYDTFTLTAFPAEHKKALGLLGTKSGRDGDKIVESGLTPVKSQIVAAPSFAEASLSIECKKNYWQDMNPAHFLDADTRKHYPNHDYHRIYFGEVLQINGTTEFLS